MKHLLINIRGTCGAGKSYIVHQIRNARLNVPVYDATAKRRRPIGYTVGGGLFIVGHYEIPIGGIDTFKTLDEAYEVVDRWGATRHILCEGKAQNRDVEYLTKRQSTFDVVAINLTTSPAQAIASVRQRGHNISETIIQRTYRKCQRDAAFLKGAGVRVIDANRTVALQMVRNMLGLT
jgi:hypothetical protein